MPVPIANVSGDINAAIGEVSTLRVTAVYSDPVWADETNNAVIVGGGVIPVTSDGLIDVTLPQTNDTVRVAINVEYVDNATRQRKSASSGWQELTADVDFATFMATTPTSVPLSTAEALAARLDALEAGGGGGSTSGALTVVGSGAVDLDNTEADGYLIGYKFTGSVLVEGVAFGAGSYIFERDSTVASGWTYRELPESLTLVAGPADTTAPVAGTLTGSAITETTFTLTVTGASDAVSLATAPYAFSTDNGTTWTAYQTSATYNATGRTASTAYQCRHRVKDAAGNVTTGTAITVTTAAVVLPSVTEDFNRTDGTTLNGKTTTTGGATLISPARSVAAGDNATDATTTSGKVTVPTDPPNSGRNIAILTSQQNYEVSIDYTLGFTSGGYQARIAARAAVPDDTTNALNSVVLIVKGDGSLGWESAGTSGFQTLAGSGIPATGRMTLRAVGTTFTAYIDGVQVGSPWTNNKTGGYAVAGVYNGASSMDNFKVQNL